MAYAWLNLGRRILITPPKAGNGTRLYPLLPADSDATIP